MFPPQPGMGGRSGEHCHPTAARVLLRQGMEAGLEGRWLKGKYTVSDIYCHAEQPLSAMRNSRSLVAGSDYKLMYTDFSCVTKLYHDISFS